jgi:spore coat polysaccharide biosynthesis protein SpsF (cytidylyltransferase family)
VSRAVARVAAIVQARATSTRLPGKVLADIGGEEALALLLRRLTRAKELSDVVVATSEESSDDAVAALATDRGARVVRGPLEDVLERYRGAIEAIECDAVVRITADCPLIDPAVVDGLVERWREGDEEYVANVIEPRSYPVGQDAEVVSSHALRKAAAGATEPYDREHVTPYIRERPDVFPQARVGLDPPLDEVRMVLDTQEDLESLRRLVEKAGPDAPFEEYARLLGGP